MTERLRAISWNLNARRDCAAQAAAMAAFEPDIVALQEVTPGGIERLRELFLAARLPHLLAGRELALAAGQESVAVRSVALASRWPLEPCDPAPVPRRELVVCAAATTPLGRVEVVSVHIPTWANGAETKTLTQEGVVARIASCATPVVLLGDFNAPKDKLPDGTVVPFTRRRAVHGYAPREASWYWKNRGRTGGFRLDHIFASTGLAPTACWYAHHLRLAGLSDHSPIIADFTGKGGDTET